MIFFIWIFQYVWEIFIFGYKNEWYLSCYLRFNLEFNLAVDVIFKVSIDCLKSCDVVIDSIISTVDLSDISWSNFGIQIFVVVGLVFKRFVVPSSLIVHSSIIIGRKNIKYKIFKLLKHFITRKDFYNLV